MWLTHVNVPRGPRISEIVCIVDPSPVKSEYVYIGEVPEPHNIEKLLHPYLASMEPFVRSDKVPPTGCPFWRLSTRVPCGNDGCDWKWIISFLNRKSSNLVCWTSPEPAGSPIKEGNKPFCGYVSSISYPHKCALPSQSVFLIPQICF